MRPMVLFGIWTLGIVLANAVCGHADTITLVETPLANVLDGSYTVASSFTETDVVGDHLSAAIYSQAYGNGEHYVYFYQISNTGDSGDSAVTEFVLGTFAGTVTDADVGYLPGTGVPDDFYGSEATRPPEDTGFVNLLSDGSQLFIYHGWRENKTISPDEFSRVLFIRSDYSHGNIDGYVSSGFATADGAVVGAVSEPSVACLLTTAGLLMVANIVGPLVRNRRQKCQTP